MCVCGGDIIILIHRMDQMFSQLVYVSLPRAGGGRPAPLRPSFPRCSVFVSLATHVPSPLMLTSSSRTATGWLTNRFLPLPPADPSSSASHPPLDLNSG